MKFKIFFSSIILLASLSSLATEKIVIGKDDRKQITRRSKTEIHESIGILFHRAPDGFTYYCTGTVIGPRHVVTAAHCIHPRVSSYYFIPGNVARIYRNIESKIPKNAIKSIAGIQYPGFTVKDASKTDVGIIIFPEDLETPILPLKISEEAPQNITIAGYPLDKPQGTMWEDSGLMFNSSYLIDTFGGQSGSAIRNTQNEIIGIHSHSLNTTGRNYACLFKQEHIDFLEKFLRMSR